MKVIVCSFEGCLASIETTEPVTSVVRYTCREHVEKAVTKEPRFQNSQFDPGIGAGTDPKTYESGRGFSSGRKYSTQRTNVTDEPRHITNIPRSFIEGVIKNAAPELDTHENKNEILDVLVEDVRNHNDGKNKSKEIEYDGPELNETNE